LASGAVPSDRLAAVNANLRNEILVGQKGHFDVGDPVFYYMTRYLAEHDANDLVFTYMNQRTYPGYGHFIQRGLNTWPETWGALEPDASMIHGCFTGISAWMVRGVLGIRPDPASPGFKHFVIKPAIAGDITWAKGEYRSPYGRIGCDWALNDGMLNVNVNVPANSSATVYLPVKDAKSPSLQDSPGKALAGIENGCAVFHVQSGRHEFSIPFSHQPD
jgi:alpha-L-rhamnosidase